MLAVYAVRIVIPPPNAVENRSGWYALSDANLLTDSSWQSKNGRRQLDQNVFDAVIDQINQATGIVWVDMFLFNDWQGPTPETHRALAEELTDALVVAQKRQPSMPIIVITDPVNTLYGGVESEHLQALIAEGVFVVQTPLVELQDSNPIYSAIWRGLIKPFGNQSGVSSVAPPFGTQKISVRSWLALLNFKANHRKLLITQSGKDWQALVSSANPHDGSSAHRNVAVQFSGDAVLALLRTEHQLLQLSSSTKDEPTRIAAQNASERLNEWFSNNWLNPLPSVNDEQQAGSVNAPMVRVLTEKAILQAVLATIDASNEGDEVDVLMFYLSHRSIVKALKNAAKRGAQVRVLLDANKDAFGRTKNGVPNRPVAHELNSAGVQVRWCATSGEQCHAKVIHTQQGEQQRLILGSGNYTRRNLDNLNLETNIDITVQGDTEVIESFKDYFNAQWLNRDNRIYSEDYEAFADDSLFKTLQYRFMEASGVGTF